MHVSDEIVSSVRHSDVRIVPFELRQGNEQQKYLGMLNMVHPRD